MHTISGQKLTMFYERSCDTNPYGRNTSANTCNDDQCECVTDLCNNVIIELKGTLDCIYCSEVSFLDTGCGRNVNTSSPYVTVMKKCLSCYTENSIIKYREYPESNVIIHFMSTLLLLQVHGVQLILYTDVHCHYCRSMVYS